MDANALINYMMLGVIVLGMRWGYEFTHVMLAIAYRRYSLTQYLRAHLKRYEGRKIISAKLSGDRFIALIESANAEAEHSNSLHLNSAMYYTYGNEIETKAAQTTLDKLPNNRYRISIPLSRLWIDYLKGADLRNPNKPMRHIVMANLGKLIVFLLALASGLSMAHLKTDFINMAFLLTIMFSVLYFDIAKMIVYSVGHRRYVDPHAYHANYAR